MRRWRKLNNMENKGDYFMKNWKQCTLFVFMALLVFTFISCGDPDNKSICECIEKEHLGISQGKCADICECSEQIAIINSTNIQIRKLINVNIGQMETAVIMLNEIYTVHMGIEQKQSFQNNILEIRLGVSGTVIDYNSTTKILTINWDVTISVLGPWLDHNNLI